MRARNYERAILSNGRCAYRGDKGLPCLIGLHIPEDAYKSDMEGVSIDSLVFNYPTEVGPIFQGINTRLLEVVQGAHDHCKTPTEFENNIELICRVYNLTYPPL